MEDNRLPKQEIFGELASGKRKQGRSFKRFKDCVKARRRHPEITPKELEPRDHDRTGWRALTRHAMDTFEERRRTQIEMSGKEERCRPKLPAIPVSSHARTVPGPASLESDSTATSVPMLDGSNAEERYHQFRWATTMCARAYVGVWVNARVYGRVFVDVCVCVCVCVCARARAWVCGCVYVHAFVSVLVRVCVRVHLSLSYQIPFSTPVLHALVSCLNCTFM